MSLDVMRFTRSNNACVARACRIASAQLKPREVFDDLEAFITERVLRLYREGGHDPKQLASAAIGLWRDEIQRRQSIYRIARLPHPD